MDEFIDNGKTYLPAKKVAEHFKLTPNYLIVLAGKKRIPGIKLGRKWYFEIDGVREYLVHESVPGETVTEEDYI